MQAQNEPNVGATVPQVEIHVVPRAISAAAGGGGGSRLSQQQINAIQQTVIGLVAGFRPPVATEGGDGLSIKSLELELGFKVEAGVGSILNLFLDAKAESNIVARVVWSR
jgi:hypothetical protein